MTDLADKFFASLLSSGDGTDYTRLGDVAGVFEHVPSDKDDHDILQNFFGEFGKLPELETFNELTGKNLRPEKESPEFYFKKLTERHIKKTLIKSAQLANTKLQEGNVQAAFEAMREAIDDLSLQKLSSDVFDFRESHDLMKAELLAKKNPEHGVNLGWPFVDEKTGGLRANDLLSICGRVGMGKTIMMLYAALHTWESQNNPVVFISMEMSPIQIFERMAAMHQHIPHDRVKHGEFSTLRKNTKDRFLNNIKKLENENIAPFYVVDGNFTATIREVTSLTKQLNPKAVFVDGAYLVKTDEGFSKHEKIGIVCNALKRDISAKLRTPVIASWQLNREATKLKTNKKVGTEHIGDSDEIGRASSIVLGLFQEETAGTIKQREVQFLKGRNGESGEFSIKWDFSGMNFSEIEEIQDHEIMIT